MHTLITTIAKGLIAPLLFVAGIAGYQISPVQAPIVQTVGENLALGAYNYSGGGTYRLRTTAGSSDTSIQLSSFKEPTSNIPYTMSYLNTTIGYGTLDPQTTKSEFISFSGITQNSNGTAVLTGVTRGLSRSYPYTASTTFRLPHAGQSIFILSDSPEHFNQFAVKSNDETITGQWTFSNFPITASTSFASETVAGVVELATQTEAASSTSSGTLARLVLPASIATSTWTSTNSPLRVVMTNPNGKIDTNFISTSTLTSMTFTGTTTMASTTVIGSTNALDIGKRIQVFTASTTFIVPTGIQKIKVEVIGGGGGGGGAGAAGGGSGGGGAGAYCLNMADVSATSSIAVVIGLGGIGVSGNNGNTGGTSSFGNYCSSTGGSGANLNSHVGGAGGTATLGVLNVTGGSGGTGYIDSNSSSVTGTGGTGGSSYFGSGGAGGAANDNGVNGSAYGSGGGGSSSPSGGINSTGGTGANGIVIITY